MLVARLSVAVTLEEWIALVLRAEGPAVLARASPMTRPGERAVNRPG